MLLLKVENMNNFAHHTSKTMYESLT